jgi:hypothetical protein
METVPKNVLDFWTAFDAVEPIGEIWKQSAQTQCLIERQIELEAMKVGAKFEPSTFERHMPARFMPDPQPKPKRTKRAAMNEFEKLGESLGLGAVIKSHGHNNKSG